MPRSASTSCKHLEEPDAALQEMRWVVKPGGWIVAGEPYLLGNEVDHPDTEALHLVLAHGFKRFKNPRIGLELNRRMAQTGLIESRTELFTRPVTELDPHHATVFGEIAAEAVSEGLLTQERAVVQDRRITAWQPLEPVQFLRNPSRRAWREGFDAALLRADLSPTVHLPLADRLPVPGEQVWLCRRLSIPPSGHTPLFPSVAARCAAA